MAAPAYLEGNGRASIPSRLRPAAGSTLVVQLVPRPPATVAELVNANPAAQASVSWVDDDGTGHLEPLWLLVELPSGGPLEPVPDGTLEVDLYGGSFVRVRSSVLGAAAKVVGAQLAAAAGPGGEAIASTSALRALGGVVWVDEGGQLGHVRKGGTDYTVAELADAIDAGELFAGTLDTVSDPGHPILELAPAPAGTRRRATLGDLVDCLGLEPVVLLQLVDAGGAEVDVTGTATQLPTVDPSAPWSSGVTVEELARALSVGLPSSGSGPTIDRLELAIAAAEDAVGQHTGRRTAGDWPDPIPAGPRTAVLQLATRFYRVSDVAFGVLSDGLGTSYTGRMLTPELEAALLGWRRSWGIA